MVRKRLSPDGSDRLSPDRDRRYPAAFEKILVRFGMELDMVTDALIVIRIYFLFFLNELKADMGRTCD